MADIDATRGLDAVIATIVDTLPRRDHWCVEFGAWDGLLASNTRNLIAHHGYSAVLIEADSSKFRELERLYIDRPDVTTIHASSASIDPMVWTRFLPARPFHASSTSSASTWRRSWNSPLRRGTNSFLLKA